MNVPVVVIINDKKQEYLGYTKPRYSCFNKADNGNRTRLSSLGSWRSTNEPYLRSEHGIRCTTSLVV